MGAPGWWQGAERLPEVVYLDFELETVAKEFCITVSAQDEQMQERILAREEVEDLLLFDLADFFRRIDPDIRQIQSEDPSTWPPPRPGLERVNPEDDKETRGGK